MREQKKILFCVLVKLTSWNIWSDIKCRKLDPKNLFRVVYTSENIFSIFFFSKAKFSMKKYKKSSCQRVKQKLEVKLIEKNSKKVKIDIFSCFLQFNRTIS